MNFDIIREQGLFRFLFGFGGRAPRSEFWTYVVVSILIGFAFGFAQGFLIAMGVHGIPGLIAFAHFVFTVWGGLAIQSRRLHDLDHSLWILVATMGFTIAMCMPFLFVLADYIASNPRLFSGAGPVVPEPPQLRTTAYLACLGGVTGGLFWLWLQIKMAFFRGTDGINRFGRNPLN